MVDCTVDLFFAVNQLLGMRNPVMKKMRQVEANVDSASKSLFAVEFDRFEIGVLAIVRRSE